jgi:hypothetical protein
MFALLGGIIVYAIFFIISYNRLDPDFGWHLITGRYILAHGIPYHDLYAYTSHGHAWVDHEWGNDVIQALLFKGGGYLLSSVFFALIWTAGVLLVGWGRRIIVLILATLAMVPYAAIRPVAWTVMLFALTLRILQAKNKNWRYILPLLVIIWANLHAGFIAGLALIIYFAVIELDIGLGIIFVLSAVSALINPYGFNLYREIASTIFDPNIHNQITEWRSFYITTPSEPYVLLWLAGFLVFAKPFWKRWISLGPLLLATALDASRNLPLFVIVTIAEFNDYANRGITKLLKPKMLIQKFMIGLCAALAIVVFMYVIYTAFSPYQSRSADYPVQAVAYLKKHSCSGNLFNDYDYGGYLIWKLPNTPVYIDGIMTTWVKHMNEYFNILHNPQRYYSNEFQHYDITCALLSQNTIDKKLIGLLEARHWQIKVTGNGSILLEKPTKI